MSHDGIEDLGPIEESPKKLAEARPYISYKSLISTNRAVKYSRVELLAANSDQRQVCHDLILQFAGDHDDLGRDNFGRRTRRIRYASKKLAREGERAFLMELRQARTDFQYNKILISILTAIRDEQIREHLVRDGYTHIHECSAADAEECKFPWGNHTIEAEGSACECSPEVNGVMVAHNKRDGEEC